MNLKREFVVNKKSQEVLPLLKKYIQEHKFKLKSSTDKSLTFTRGSLAHNFIAFNALTWKSLITASAHPAGSQTKVTVNFDITTTGQMVSPMEENVWKNFADHIEPFLNGKEMENGEKKGKKLGNYVLKWILLVLLFSLVAGAVGGLLIGVVKYYTGIRIDSNLIIMPIIACVVLILIKKFKL